VIPAIIVHGSARMTPNLAVSRVLTAAATRGCGILSKGGLALDAVEEAIRMCEDSGEFNAGRGAHLNLVGEAEMDASIMDGKSLGSGAVAILKGVRNPISVARRILESADKTMVILAGEGAYKFATANSFETISEPHPERLRYWKQLREALDRGGELPGINLPDPGLLREFLKKDPGEGTVGAVAIDTRRNLASGVSSGGTPLKLPGRVGDIPIIGCSNFADDTAGAVSLTGTGNIMVRYAVARWAVDLMRSGLPAQKAVETVVSSLNEKVNEFVLGIIAVDAGGGFGVARNLDGMPHAYMAEGMSSPGIQEAPILRK